MSSEDDRPVAAGGDVRARNHAVTSSGLVVAVCICCGQQSRPVLPDHAGEPDLFRMGRGWSQALFPHDFEQSDGSIGSTYTCPSCNARLRNGATLKLRAYLVEAAERTKRMLRLAADQAANFAIAILVVAAILITDALLDGPSETDALQASALDHADAIAEARLAHISERSEP